MTLAQDRSGTRVRAVSVDVEPEDEAHGAELREFAARAANEDGTLLVPDARAMAAHLPWAGTLPLLPHGLASVFAGLFVMDVTGALLLAWAGYGDLPSMPFIAFGEACVAAFLGCAAWTAVSFRRGSRIGLDGAAAAEAARHGVVRGHAYVVGPDGIIVLGRGPEGPTRRFHPAASVREVVVSDEDTTHVTALVRTDHGTVDMHWLPRNGETVRALASAWPGRE